MPGELTYQHPDLEHWAEEAECAHKVLDDWGVPRKNDHGETYTLVGRIGLLRTERHRFLPEDTIEEKVIEDRGVIFKALETMPALYDANGEWAYGNDGKRYSVRVLQEMVKGSGSERIIAYFKPEMTKGHWRIL